MLRIGNDVVFELSGPPNPCAHIENFRPGLLAVVLDRSPTGEVIRKAGVMAIMRVGVSIRHGDAIAVELPPPPHRRLERV